MSGNVWMFSDEIDDEDLEFMNHDYVTYNMACEYYRLGIKPVVRMAHEAGAVYKIGTVAVGIPTDITVRLVINTIAFAVANSIFQTFAGSCFPFLGRSVNGGSITS